MSHSPTPEIDCWLDSATRGLGPEAAAAARRELAGHVEEAAAAYVQKGLSPDEARRRALADLGPAEATAGGLNDVHRGSRHYALAVLASLFNLSILLTTHTLHQQLGLVEATTASNLFLSASDLVLTSLVVYVLLTLRRLLAWRFQLERLRPYFVLAIAGLVVESVEIAVSRHAFGYSLWGEVSRTFFSAVSPLDTALLVTGVVCRLAVGAGLVPIALALWRSPEDLYGLAKPLALVCAGVGIFLPGTVLLIQLGAMQPVILTYALTTASNMLAWPILTLIFYRAAFRDPTGYPTRWA